MSEKRKAVAITADGITHPFAIADVPWDEYSHGQSFATRYQQLGEYGGCQRVGVCIEELAPGKQACPNHYHHLEEEQILILEGSLSLRLGDQTYVMTKDSYVVFPAGQKAGHSIYNHTDSVCRYLLIGERNSHDVVVYPDSQRVGVRLTGEGYDKNATLEYWEREKD